jgi:hypothetical protein
VRRIDRVPIVVVDHRLCEQFDDAADFGVELQQILRRFLECGALIITGIKSS